MKQMTRIYRDNIRWDLDDKSLATISDVVQELIKLHGPTATLDISGEDVELAIYQLKEESDEEYAARVKRESDWDRILEEQERAQYEVLKKKFGGVA